MGVVFIAILHTHTLSPAIYHCMGGTRVMTQIGIAAEFGRAFIFHITGHSVWCYLTSSLQVSVQYFSYKSKNASLLPEILAFVSYL